jgi:N-carbamoyl-L-amino-acid hydrolase
MAVRAEESVWFQVSYIGSRSALGTLPANAMQVRRIDTDRTLKSHIRDSGGDPDALANCKVELDPSQVRAFLELHIEQAPSLLQAGVPVAIGAGIPGNFRYAAARVLGRYDHVGTPRRFRSDAVLAASEFAFRMDQIWLQKEAEGIAMAVTLGRFHTDMNAHGMTTVAGDFAFSIDVRAYEPVVLADLEKAMLEIVRDIERTRNVSFQLGPRAEAPVGYCCKAIAESLSRGSEMLGVNATTLLSPASHDAAAFGQAGVPIGMIFIRNENGSHNPQEHMDISDFLQGTAVLTWWIIENLA